MKEILKRAYEYSLPFTKEGELVDYIDALKSVNKEDLGAVIIDENKNIESIGVVDTKFTIMSIVKVALYLIVLENYEQDEIKKYMGSNGSSKAFNSLLDLESSEDKKPVNPFINAGAIMSCYLIYKKFKEKSKEVVLEKLRSLTDNKNLDVDKKVLDSIGIGGDTNIAILYSLKKNKIMANDEDAFTVLGLYNYACTILVDIVDLAKFSYVLSNNGKSINDEKLIDEENVRILKTLMLICGMYDYSGEYAIKVGLPSKSGVGGGIMATTNKKIGLATYSPALDLRGNSVAGQVMLEYISKELDLYVI